jgi:hypothetical protein
VWLLTELFQPPYQVHHCVLSSTKFGCCFELPGCLREDTPIAGSELWRRHSCTNYVSLVCDSRFTLEDGFVTYSKLLCNLNAIGASGSMIVSQAFLTSTPRIALRVTFLAVDFAPRVATNLCTCQFPSSSSHCSRQRAGTGERYSKTEYALNDKEEG